MKAKIIILILCLLQLFFLFILVSYNRDVADLIEVGVEHLKGDYPSEAPTYSTTPDGASTLKTPGDFLVAARQDYLFQTAVSFIIATINILLLFCLFIVLRKKRNISDSQISKT